MKPSNESKFFKVVSAVVIPLLVVVIAFLLDYSVKPEYGSLQVEVPLDSVKVLIDKDSAGIAFSNAVFKRDNLLPGSHILAIEKNGQTLFTSEFNITAGEVTSKIIRLNLAQKQDSSKPKLNDNSSIPKPPVKREIPDSIKPSVPAPNKMITLRLLVDNRLRNGDVFVDGEQVLSNSDAIAKTIQVVGFMRHEIIVATQTDTCRASGYFGIDNESISMNCK